jgi:hypothetical protein
MLFHYAQRRYQAIVFKWINNYQEGLAAQQVQPYTFFTGFMSYIRPKTENPDAAGTDFHYPRGQQHD